MIENLPKKVGSDKGKHRIVSNYATDRYKSYFGSPCFTTLNNRVNRLNESIDLKFNSANNSMQTKGAWRTKIAVPLVRESFLALRAITSANFIQDPLVDILAEYSTPVEIAKNMKSLMNSNLRTTLYRERTMDPIIDSCSRHGTSVSVQYFRDRTTKTKRTIPVFINNKYMGTDRVMVERGGGGSTSKMINKLCYFQHPSVPDPRMSPYQGYYEPYALDELIQEYKHAKKLKEQGQDTGWLLDYLKEAIENAKKDGNDQYSNRDNTGRDEWGWLDVTMYHYFGKLNITGNEDDDTWYYLKLINDKIVFIEELDTDENMVPIAIFNYDKRPDYWWGNVPSEGVIPSESWIQFFMTMAADEGLKGLQKFVFYDKSRIKPDAINSRFKNGGFMAFDGRDGRGTQGLFADYQFNNTGILNNGQYLVSEFKEYAQRVTPNPDYARTANQGGLTNKTAFAASLISEQGDVANNFYLQQFAKGLRWDLRNQMILLQMHLPEEFQTRELGSENPLDLVKGQILGPMGVKVRSTLSQNKTTRSTKLLNAMTQIQNFKGSGDPTWMNVDISKIAKGWLNTILDGEENVDDMFPPVQIPGQQPQIPGQPQQPGLPAPQPQQQLQQPV